MLHELHKRIWRSVFLEKLYWNFSSSFHYIDTNIKMQCPLKQRRVWSKDLRDTHETVDITKAPRSHFV
jgi:hypothetical protein